MFAYLFFDPLSQTGTTNATNKTVYSIQHCLQILILIANNKPLSTIGLRYHTQIFRIIFFKD